jgi:hypothetical protein
MAIKSVEEAVNAAKVLNPLKAGKSISIQF